MTAVEWLIENSHIIPKNELNKIELIKQAKEMEKQQITDAFSEDNFEYKGYRQVNLSAEKYYKDTYETNH
jgi:hypothetical protein